VRSGGRYGAACRSHSLPGCRVMPEGTPCSWMLTRKSRRRKTRVTFRRVAGAFLLQLGAHAESPERLVAMLVEQRRTSDADRARRRANCHAEAAPADSLPAAAVRRGAARPRHVALSEQTACYSRRGLAGVSGCGDGRRTPLEQLRLHMLGAGPVRTSLEGHLARRGSMPATATVTSKSCVRRRIGPTGKHRQPRVACVAVEGH